MEEFRRGIWYISGELGRGEENRGPDFCRKSGKEISAVGRKISLPIRRRWLCREGGQAWPGKNLLDRRGKNGRSSNDASVRLASHTVSLRHTPSAVTNRPDPGKNGLAVPNANLNRDARFHRPSSNSPNKSPVFHRETAPRKLEADRRSLEFNLKERKQMEKAERVEE